MAPEGQLRAATWDVDAEVVFFTFPAVFFNGFETFVSFLDFKAFSLVAGLVSLPFTFDLLGLFVVFFPAILSPLSAAG